MKLTKALKLIKKYCSEDNCYIGVCPLAYSQNGEKYATCMISMDDMDNWNPKEINRCVKMMETKEKALTRGVLPHVLRKRSGKL